MIVSHKNIKLFNSKITNCTVTLYWRGNENRVIYREWRKIYLQLYYKLKELIEKWRDKRKIFYKGAC